MKHLRSLASTSLLLTSVLAFSAHAQSTSGSAQLDLKTSTVVLVDSKGNTLGTFDSKGKLTVKGDLKLASKAVVSSKTGSKQEFMLSGAVNSKTQLNSLRVMFEGKTSTLVSIFAKSNTSGNVTGGSTSSTSTNSSVSGTVSGNTSTSTSGSTSGSASGSGNIGISIGGENGSGAISIGIGGGVGIGIGKP
jgi:hypothetical protein